MPSPFCSRATSYGKLLHAYASIKRGRDRRAKLQASATSRMKEDGHIELPKHSMVAAPGVFLMHFAHIGAWLRAFAAPVEVGSLLAQIQPDWASVLTAQSTFAMALLTAILAVGVLFAGLQFLLTRRFNRVLETDNLIKELCAIGLWEVLQRLDKFDDMDANTKRASRLYAGIQRFKKRKYFRGLGTTANDFIDNRAQITDRIEIYIRKGVADESIVAEHLAYYIIVMYCFLKEVLQQRAGAHDYNYDSFRDLTRRLQDYGKLYPLDVDLRERVLYEHIPPLHYRGGDSSRGYSLSNFRRFRLWIIETRRGRKKARH